MNKIIKIKIIGSSESVINNHRTAIISQIDTIETAQALNSIVYENQDSKYEFTSDVKFINDQAGIDFDTWIKNYITSNSTDFENGSVNSHDCNHDSGGKCENLVDWNL